MKKHEKIKFILIGVGVLGFLTWLVSGPSVFSESDFQTEHPTCLHLYVKFHSDWGKIQKLFSNDPTFFGYLDRDMDKVPCEKFINKRK